MNKKICIITVANSGIGKASVSIHCWLKQVLATNELGCN